MKEPVSEAWLCDEALRIAGSLIDAHMERDASVVHQMVRRLRIATGRIDNLEIALEACNEWFKSGEARIAELEAERDRLRQTLEWYADVTDYDLSVDAGERARAAIGARPAP